MQLVFIIMTASWILFNATSLTVVQYTEVYKLTIIIIILYLHNIYTEHKKCYWVRISTNQLQKKKKAQLAQCSLKLKKISTHIVWHHYGE